MRASRADGFTLIEVVVAVAIFALVGVAAAQLLMRVLDAEARARERTERLQALQRAVRLLERDVLQHVERGVRDQLGDPLPPLVIDAGERLELTRRGWRNPLDLPRSELQRVAWAAGEEDVLERVYWTVLDRAQDSEPARQAVLEGLDELRFRVVDRDGGRWEFWPPEHLLPGADRASPDGSAAAAANEGAPEAAAVEVALRVAPFGEVIRLIRLPAPAPEIAAAGDGERGGERDGRAEETTEDTGEAPEF